MVGDIDCSNRLREQIKKTIPHIPLQWDTCYEPDLAKFEQTYDDMKNTLNWARPPGNHDAEEDGNPNILRSLSILNLPLVLIVKGMIFVIGLNTNGDMVAQASWG